VALGAEAGAYLCFYADSMEAGRRSDPSGRSLTFSHYLELVMGCTSSASSLRLATPPQGGVASRTRRAPVRVPRHRPGSMAQRPSAGTGVLLGRSRDQPRRPPRSGLRVGASSGRCPRLPSGVACHHRGLLMISTTQPHRSVGAAGSLAVLRRGRCQRSRRGLVGQMSAIIVSYQIVT
jgi:hypothetical protein